MVQRVRYCRLPRMLGGNAVLTALHGIALSGCLSEGDAAGIRKAFGTEICREEAV